MEAYKEAVAQCLTEPLGQPPEAIVALLRTPPEPAWGDYALPCFSFAKAWRQAPPQIAAQLAETIAVRPPIATVKAQGPYLNFTLDVTCCRVFWRQGSITGMGRKAVAKRS